VSVTRLHSLYPAFSGEVVDGVYYPRKPGLERVASSSLGHLVYENGAVYAFTLEHWKRTRNRMGGDMRALVLHWSEAVDVDTPEDLDACRRLAR
jgi:CMP-N-acetylneuraminic acid synthetase